MPHFDTPRITDVHADEVNVTASAELPKGLLENAKPVILRNYISNWPAVQKAKQSSTAFSDYLSQFYNGKSVHLMKGDAKDRGRLFYNDDMSGFNFSRSQADLQKVLQTLNGLSPMGESDTYYVGSTAVDSILPGFRSGNDLLAIADRALVSIWIGNQSRIAAHYDAPDNIACVVAGHRRFILFPPEQIENLYVGPLDFTPAGQPASLVDFHNPDLEKYPKFKEAQKAAVVAELGPGDAIYIPSLWWHHVEGLDSFNVLINYWWRQVDNYVGVPADALYHAMLAIRALPKSQRQGWKQLFDHYIFSDQDVSHIPEDKQGSLAPLTNTLSRQIRSLLLNKLNR
jgi:hypothetical protein